MPSTINQYPPGLLALFDMKARGTTPPALDDVAQLAFDLKELYLHNQSRTWAETIFLSGTSEGWNASTALVVPEGQIWWIHWIGMIGSLTAAGYNHPQPAMQIPSAYLPAIPDVGNTVVAFPATPTAAVTGLTGAAPAGFYQPPQPLIAKPGFRFGAVVLAATGSTNLTININFTPLSV